MNNKIGMNLLLWGTEIDDRLFPTLERLKEIGYDGVEIPIFNTNPDHWYGWRKVLDDLKLDRVAVTINGPDFNQIDQNLSQRKATLARNKMALDCAMILGSDLLTGPFHSALGVFTGKKATEDEKLWAKEGLFELAEYADNLGITLGLEYLNRFESYLVSCADELVALVKDIDHPACKIMFDSFHANIEERSLPKAIKEIGDKLVHVQLSENNRSTIGTGHIDFRAIISTLQEINYTGMISVEAFSTKLSVANIWRKMFETELQLAEDSYKYLKAILK